MEVLQHECGIAAIYHLNGPTQSPLLQAIPPNSASRLMPRILLDLQNRGQLAAGFSTFNPNRGQILDTYNAIGTVVEAFRTSHRAKYADIMNDFDGQAAIGHVRYATCGPESNVSLNRSSDFTDVNGNGSHRIQRPTREFPAA